MKNNNWKLALVVSIIIGGFISLFASSFPDGLNKIAELQGFSGNGKQTIAGIMPKYSVQGIKIEIIAKSLAGALGTSVVFALLFVMGKSLYKPVDEKKQ